MGVPMIFLLPGICTCMICSFDFYKAYKNEHEQAQIKIPRFSTRHFYLTYPLMLEHATDFNHKGQIFATYPMLTKHQQTTRKEFLILLQIDQSFSLILFICWHIDKAEYGERITRFSRNLFSNDFNFETAQETTTSIGIL